jgi:hypothetical protein
VIEYFNSSFWMDAMMFLFEHRNLWWVGRVQCTFQSWELCLSAVGTNGMASALRNLECAESLSILSGK